MRNLLDSIHASVLPPETTVTIINTNRKELRHRVSFEVPHTVRVFDTLQPTSATGHTARHYNEALVHGFDSLVTPRLDVVVTVQADSTFCPHWWAAVTTALLSGCQFVQAGAGDQVRRHEVFLNVGPLSLSPRGYFRSLWARKRLTLAHRSLCTHQKPSAGWACTTSASSGSATTRATTCCALRLPCVRRPASMTSSTIGSPHRPLHLPLTKCCATRLRAAMSEPRTPPRQNGIQVGTTAALVEILSMKSGQSVVSADGAAKPWSLTGRARPT